MWLSGKKALRRPHLSGVGKGFGQNKVQTCRSKFRNFLSAEHCKTAYEQKVEIWVEFLCKVHKRKFLQNMNLIGIMIVERDRESADDWPPMYVIKK